MIYLYSFFHLNLAYSAIEEDQRKDVIEKCYWPIFKLPRELKIPIGIEMPAYTLELIRSIDPEFVEELKELIEIGMIEIICSGYSQIIAPLVPFSVNQKNIEIGQKIYKKILAKSPSIALINEQAFSSGLIDLYLEFNFNAIIMEWENPYSNNKDWNEDFLYYPQYVLNSDNGKIPVIWNSSIMFQKIQRYAHGLIESNEVMSFLEKFQANSPRYLPFYGNDVEVFDFRPGRYMTEDKIHEEGEWKRLLEIYKKINEDDKYCFVLPSRALKDKSTHAYKNLRFESTSSPILVKKQAKYNIVRWSLSGRDDLRINTYCWRIFNSLKLKGSDQDWKKLLFYWSSDFRTHITDYRWLKYLNGIEENFGGVIHHTHKQKINSNINNKPLHQFIDTKRYIRYKGERLDIKFDKYKGLAIDGYIDKKVGENNLFGTIHHGYFDNINYSADFYTGHIIIEQPGKAKITDLISVKPSVEECQNENCFKVSCEIDIKVGMIRKSWKIFDKEGRVEYEISIDQADKKILATIRLGFLTLNSEEFDYKSLMVKTHNGGKNFEKFNIDPEVVFSHLEPVSPLISASQLFSMTEGEIQIYDSNKMLQVLIDKSDSAVCGMMQNFSINRKNLTRFCFSAREIDETSKKIELNNFHLKFNIFSGKKEI